MRRKSSLWKTTAVSLSAMMTLSMGAAVLAAGTEQTTHESQNEDNTENKSADTDEASNTAETKTEECKIELSDNGILVDGEAISENPEDSVYVGADIIYYKEGQDSTYGAGDEDDGHFEEEAAAHTVITIAKAGTYRVSGTLSKGQIAIDLGEDSRDDESAVVNLILDNADITCTVSSAIVVYNAYECGSDDTETATKDVDTTNAGVNIILADDSENTVTGSHVAKIYKEGTTQEDVDAGNAKKQWKFDAAIESLVSIAFDAEEEGTGSLAVNSDNEGIETYLHLTVNGGNININSFDDGINANEDGVSVITINGGVVIVNAGAGQEGDGIDSNGWIVINDGFIVTAANATSPDSGVDIEVTSIEDETQLQYGSKNAGGFGENGGAPMGGQAPNGQEGEAPSMPEGEMPSKPEGEAPDMAQIGDEEGGTVFTISGITNTFSNISKATASE